MFNLIRDAMRDTFKEINVKAIFRYIRIYNFIYI